MLDRRRALLASIVLTASLLAGSARAQPAPASPGAVEVRGRELLRDGRPWIPHGFYQIAFEVAPANLGRADHQFWRIAQENYSPQEYADMRAAGADSVRIQISQAGADPGSPIHDDAFFGKALDAVRAARRAGLTVIVSIQGESHVHGQTPLALPGPGTRRIWHEIARQFGDDRGVLFELLNEPQPPPNPENWAKWKTAMTETAHTVRETGARNVIIADGLGAGQVLDGAPLLDDPQVAYASHPYANKQRGQTSQAWDDKFGRFAQRAPVIITEWLFGGYLCNADTPDATLRFLRYIQDRGIGVEVGIWDWHPGGFGSVRWDFPNGKFSTFVGLACHQPGYGMGRVIERWFTTGSIPAAPE